MKKPLFYFEKTKMWEIGVVIFYVLLSVEFCFFLRLAESEVQNRYLHFYAFFTQLFLYGLFYKAMRNMKIYIFCLMVGFLHLCLFYVLKENASLIHFHNNNVVALRNTIILLFIFQILRLVSLRTQHQELVCPGKDRKDFFDQRKTTNVDSLLFALYVASVFLLLCL